MKSTDEIAKYIIDKLKEKDFIVHYYHSYTSNSIYLKLDYGASNSIRISDHDSKNDYHYKYEIRTDKALSWKRFEDNQYMIRYPENQVDNLIQDIFNNKANKIKAKGLDSYNREMIKREKYMDSNRSKKFYKLCEEVEWDEQRQDSYSKRNNSRNRKFTDNER